MVRMIGRRWLGVGVTVVVLGIIGFVAVWQSLSQATNPNYQIRNEQAGVVNEYFVNLWIDPHPARVGEADVAVQLSSIIGTAFQPDELAIKLHPPDGDPVDLDLMHRMRGGAQDHVYAATTEFTTTGQWEVVVLYSLGGPERTAAFQVEVVS